MMILKLLVSIISLLVIFILTRSSKTAQFDRTDIKDWFMIAVVLVPLNIEMWR